jgi:hypothetical protein
MYPTQANRRLEWATHPLWLGGIETDWAPGGFFPGRRAAQSKVVGHAGFSAC